jgi:hypothetical protein
LSGGNKIANRRAQTFARLNDRPHFKKWKEV